MKKFRFKFIIYSITFMLFLFSCQKDILIDGVNDLNNDYVLKQISVKDGRLFFTTEDILTSKYENIKEKKEIDIYNEMSKYYSDDFINLRPILTNENENKMKDQLVRRKIKLFDFIINKNKKDLNNINNSGFTSIIQTTPQLTIPTDTNYLENIDDLEDIIGDDAFASFLNGDGEVQVANNIYKYTDVGLFITPTNSYPELITYLDQNNISQNLLLPTCALKKQIYLAEIMPNGGLTPINNNLSYFRTPDPLVNISTPIQGCTFGGGSNGGSNSSGVSSSQSVESYIATLLPCNQNFDPFLGVFGMNKVCIDKFESTKRVKTKAFEYNYLLVYHLGVKVKNQTKGWTGLWKQENTEDMGILVNAQYKYKYPKLFGTALEGINQTYRVFAIGNNIPQFQRGYYELSNTIPFHNFIFESGAFYPYTPFDDELVIEYFGNNNIIDQTVALGNDINTRKKIDDYFTNFVWFDTRNTIINTIYFNYTMPDNITFLSKHPALGAVWVHKTYKNFATNTSKVEKTFDSGLTFKGGFNDTKFVFSIQNPKPGEIKRPEKGSFGGKIIGVAKFNEQWHGNMLEF